MALDDTAAMRGKDPLTALNIKVSVPAHSDQPFRLIPISGSD
jgi:hypothetical protein